MNRRRIQEAVDACKRESDEALEALTEAARCAEQAKVAAVGALWLERREAEEEPERLRK